MTAIVRHLTHPQVQIEPDRPVPSWGLNEKGRVRALVAAAWLKGTTRVISSAELKAIETAASIAEGLAIPLEVREQMHENGRSATGFLPPHEFEQVADEFFANPHKSVRGWERAIDAQQRIVREVETVIAMAEAGDLLFVGHGAVGTLLFCHYAKTPIDRSRDQPPGGGNYFSFRCADRSVIHVWRPMEVAPPVAERPSLR